MTPIATDLTYAAEFRRSLHCNCKSIEGMLSEDEAKVCSAERMFVGGLEMEEREEAREKGNGGRAKVVESNDYWLQ